MVLGIAESAVAADVCIMRCGSLGITMCESLSAGVSRFWSRRQEGSRPKLKPRNCVHTRPLTKAERTVQVERR